MRRILKLVTISVLMIRPLSSLKPMQKPRPGQRKSVIDFESRNLLSEQFMRR
jgi:hypothetical protein